LGFKNFVFNTASGDSADQDDINPDSEGDENCGDCGDPDDEGEGGDTDGDITTSDIAAGFAAIKNNPHYSEIKLSRTLYQVD
jgi:hypothetical protein